MDYTYQGRACNILSEVSRPCSPRRHSAYHTVYVVIFADSMVEYIAAATFNKTAVVTACGHRADHCECNVVVSVGLDDLTGEPA